MNRIDYNQTGGFPLSTQILDAAQTAYKDFNEFGKLAGNNLIIISGCEAGAGGTVTDGFVSIDGELLPFVGTTETAKVVIVETADSRGFEDGSLKPVIYERYATFGNSAIEYDWANFRRPLTLFQLEDRLTQLEKTVPIGLVAIWGKPADEIPQGWVEHTDLAGKVPVGHKPSDLNFGALDAQIGAAQIQLTQSQLPALEGEFETITGTSVNPTGIASYTYSSPTFIGGSSTPTFAHRGVKIKFGQDLPHSNIQPSRIVKFIRFVGFS